MKRVFLKPASFVFCILALGAGKVQAHSLSFNTQMQNESFKADSGKDVARMAAGVLGAEFEMNISHKLSVGVFGGAQVSATTQSNLSFGLGGFANYYFKGSPIKSEFKTASAYLAGMNRWAYYAGAGVEERFLQSPELDSEIRGGPFVRFGGRYMWNSHTFFSGSFKYLMSSEYSSIDLSLGIGFYL